MTKISDIFKTGIGQSHFCLLENQGWQGGNLLAVGCKQEFVFPTPGAFHDLKVFLKKHSDKYIFGHLNYEATQHSFQNATGSIFPIGNFFVPEYVVQLKESDYHFLQGHENDFFAQKDQKVTSYRQSKIEILPVETKEEYLSSCKRLLQHIQRGDIYEINYCTAFQGKGSIDPLRVYEKLNALNKAPFSAFYKINQSYLLCGSPERFIKKKGKTLVSQPIKGTRKRGATPEEDEQLRNELFHNEKERSENVMIVDLVRNDLSRSCKAGTVKVSELFGIHTFNTVHQMISTVEGELCDDKDGIDALEAAFPMGSMTGAPKIRAMELIREHEKMARGIYSGTVGYFSPNGDFDFNVVIRSIEYNAQTHDITLKAGSAITAAADPEKEYEECLLKANSMIQAIKSA